MQSNSCRMMQGSLPDRVEGVVTSMPQDADQAKQRTEDHAASVDDKINRIERMLEPMVPVIQGIGDVNVSALKDATDVPALTQAMDAMRQELAGLQQQFVVQQSAGGSMHAATADFNTRPSALQGLSPERKTNKLTWITNVGMT